MTPAALQALLPKVAVTHDGAFHGDDLMAAALLRALKPDMEIRRSREAAILAEAPLLFDVGGCYDVRRLRFDHHFNSPPRRIGRDGSPSGVPYSSIGLLWRHFGNLAIELHAVPKDRRERDFLCHWVDRRLVQPLDSIDSGMGKGSGDHSISYHLGSMNVAWDELHKEQADRNQQIDARFAGVLAWLAPAWVTFLANLRVDPNAAFNAFIGDIAAHTRANFTEAYRREVRARERFLAAWPRHSGPILHLDNPGCHWATLLPTLDGHLPPNRQVQFVTYRGIDGRWRLQVVPQAVPQAADSDTQLLRGPARTPLPPHWHGCRDDELAVITGVPGARFCHPGGFLCVGESREAIHALARLALAEAKIEMAA